MTPHDKIPRILFLDDEIGDASAAVVNAALSQLQTQFDVTAVQSLNEAAHEFRTSCYDVFVLDIDMRHAHDTVTPQDRRGTWLAEVIRSLDARTAVIMFSNMGQADDWLRVTNHHVYGYIDKNAADSVDRLVSMVRAAIASPSPGGVAPQPRRSGPVLVCRRPDCRLSTDELLNAVQSAGDFTMEACSLNELPGLIESDRDARRFSAVVLAADSLETRPTVQAAIQAACRAQPAPNVVFALCVEDSHLQSLLFVMNHRPFRIVNLLGSDPAAALSEAIRSAAGWYGGVELFEAADEVYQEYTADFDWGELDPVFLIDLDENQPSDGSEEVTHD